jgi:hypothetical protein
MPCSAPHTILQVFSQDLKWKPRALLTTVCVSDMRRDRNKLITYCLKSGSTSCHGVGAAARKSTIINQVQRLSIVDQIHLFGGDPNQVTIWGESAGAGSVIQHMLAHGGNTQPPLFKNVISSSSFLSPQHRFDDSMSEASSRFANWCALMLMPYILECLRSVFTADGVSRSFPIIRLFEYPFDVRADAPTLPTLSDALLASTYKPFQTRPSSLTSQNSLHFP